MCRKTAPRSCLSVSVSAAVTTLSSVNSKHLLAGFCGRRTQGLCWVLRLSVSHRASKRPRRLQTSPDATGGTSTSKFTPAVVRRFSSLLGVHRRSLDCLAHVPLSGQLISCLPSERARDGRPGRWKRGSLYPRLESDSPSLLLYFICKRRVTRPSPHSLGGLHEYQMREWQAAGTPVSTFRKLLQRCPCGDRGLRSAGHRSPLSRRAVRGSFLPPLRPLFWFISSFTWALADVSQPASLPLSFFPRPCPFRLGGRSRNG